MNNKLQNLILLVFQASFVAFGDFFENDKLSLSGHFKSTIQANRFATNTVTDPLRDDKTYLLWQNTIRLRLFYEPNDFYSFEIAYELSPVVANPDAINAQNFFNPSQSSYRVKDLPTQINSDNDGNFFLYQNLDRLNLSFKFDETDLIIGRQAISFGSGRYINPTDIFSPFLFQDLNKEHKSGVDAIRLRIAIGEMSEFDTAIVLGKDAKKDNSAVYIRGKFYYENTDISVIAMDFQNNLMLGLDVTRAIGDAGFWFECAHVFAGAFDERYSNEDYFRLTTGLDYNFSPGLYGFLEYHYNEAGASNPSDYLTNPIRSSITSDLKTAYDQGGVYLLGKHYLIPGLTYEFTPLLTGTAYTIVNVQDWSSYVGATVDYSLSENFLIQAGGFYGIGESATQQVTTTTPESEFGLYSNLIYLSLRYYF